MKKINKNHLYTAIFLALGLSTPVCADLMVGSGETVRFSSATTANEQAVTGNIVLNGGTIAKGYAGEATENIVTNPLVVNEVDGNTINTAGSGASGSWLLSGAMSGAGSVTQAGGNQLHLMNADNSGFSGTLTMTGSWLSFRTAGAASKNATYAINSSGIVFADQTDNATYHIGMLTGTNGNSEVRPSANILGSTGKTLNLVIGENNASGTFVGKINNYLNIDKTGVVNVEKAGTGTWTLTGGSSYTGTTTVSGGVLQLGNGTITPTLATSNIIVMENGTLDLKAKNTENWFFKSPLEFNGGTVTGSLAGSKLVLEGNISGSAVTVDAGTSTVFFQNGGGTLTCKATDVVSGTLILKRPLPTDASVKVNTGATLTLGNMYLGSAIDLAGTVVYNGGTLNWTADKVKLSGVLDLQSDYKLTSTIYGFLTTSATIRVSGGTTTAEAAPTVKLDLAGGKYINPAGGTQGHVINVSGADAKLQANTYNSQTGNITGTGTLTVVGPENATDITSNQIQISGNLNDFSGTLIAGSNASIGLFGSQASNSAARFGANNGLLFFKSGDASDNVYQLGDLFGNAGGIVRPSGSHVPTLTTVEVGAALSAGEESVFAGSIQDNNGKVLAFKKVGVGTWTLSGNNNIYTGDTTVSEGCLNLLGTISSSNVTVESGAALSGSGTIGKNLDILSGGTLLVDLSVLDFEPLHVNGSVNFNDGSIIQLIDTNYESHSEETFQVLSSDYELDLTGVTFDWSKAGGDIWSYGLTPDGKGFWVTAASGPDVPEPSTCVLLLLSLVGGAFWTLVRRKTPCNRVAVEYWLPCMRRRECVPKNPSDLTADA